MNDETALVVKDDVRLGALQVEPEHMIERATSIATALKKVVEDRKLYSMISGRQYVQVEGWNTLGALIGVLPREVEVKEIENGYEATVELIRTSDTKVIGRGSAICTRDERNWSKRDDYAVRSMAITRATGKAFRLGFSWIMKLAGYEPTPWEEMDGVVEAEVREVPKGASTGQNASSVPASGTGKTRTDTVSQKTSDIKQNKSDRPYPPATLKERMAERTKIHEGKTATDKQFSLAMGMLNECFASDDADEKRHSVQAYLFEVESGNDLDGAQVLALLDWVKPTKDDGGAYMPDGMAVKEASAVVKERMKELGQDELL